MEKRVENEMYYFVTKIRDNITTAKSYHKDFST
jgi:hypothetical protein